MVLLRFSNAYPKGDMRVFGGPNCSVSALGNDKRRTPMRKHPRKLSTATLIPVTTYPSLTLFGEDFEAVPWRPYVIWEADLDRQVLDEAWLAAIAYINRPTKTQIFARVPLPPAIEPPVNLDGSAPDDPEAGKWPEWPEEGSGHEPA
jgi:hypothetical protein